MPFTCTGEEFPVYAFAATGAPAKRTMPDRLADTINVKEWGALGNNSANDLPSCQAAVNKAISQGGGIVFFPPGVYLFTGTLIVGSSNQNIRVDLLGPGKQVATIGSVSSAGQAFDNLGRMEGINVNGQVVLLGNNQSINDCLLQGGDGIGVDASGATGAYIVNCGGAGGTSNPPNVPPHGARPGNMWLVLGDGCQANNCRNASGGEDIVYALSGRAPCVIGSSCETQRTAFRVGWATTFTMNTTASAGGGTNVLTFASIPNSVKLGRVISGTNVPSGCAATAIDRVANTITFNQNFTGGGITNGQTITFTNEQTAFGFAIISCQTERCDTAMDLYNCTGGIVTAMTTQGQIGSDPTQQAIATITWGAGTAHATVATPHNLPVGQTVIQLVGGSGNFYPSYGNPPGWAIANNTGSTTFDYDLPINPSIGYTANSTGWQYPELYTVRCRKVTETFIIANAFGQNSAIATLDLDYNGYNTANVSHRNNALIGFGGANGIVLPGDKRNLAGWYVLGAYGGINQLEGHAGYAGAGTTSVINCQMVFANLPGQSGVIQPGPYNGQEFDIIDSNLAATAANFGATVSGGGSNVVKVRRVGSNWTLTG